MDATRLRVCHSIMADGGNAKMRIESIKIVNFRGVRLVELDDLRSTVVIAGANGSGKSCIFDAIRLLKSAYGGYQANEWHHWMSEFQVNFQNRESLSTFIQDKSKTLEIRCEFTIRPDERAYLEAHGEELVRHSVWRTLAPELYGWSSYRAAPMAAQYRERESEAAQKIAEQLASMRKELTQDRVVGRLWIEPAGDIRFELSKVLELIFSTYDPGRLGLIDYHGPQRMYGRETVANVNLDLEAAEQQQKAHALYNYNNKYNTVKTEMAGAYVKDLLASAGGSGPDSSKSIAVTLKKLFETFFPDKQFNGPIPTPDGRLSFPVITPSGTHDLNELSAGEKEVLYGYLRIRASAPHYSIIPVDEPELHLNPGLIRGLPKFYHDNLGVALDNQIWLITHSDALLREVVGKPEYSVFHMTSAAAGSAGQAKALSGREDVERAVISLVGDLATYRPGERVVIFEGGGDSEFDRAMTIQLFPELAERVNVISGGNKVRVRDLHAVLEAATNKGTIPFRIFSVTDRDSEPLPTKFAERFIWDVYHIENYLLEAEYIQKVERDLGRSNRTVSQIYDRLRSTARKTLPQMVRHKLTVHADGILRSMLNLTTNPKAGAAAVGLDASIEKSISKLMAARTAELSPEALQAQESALTAEFEADLAGDNWRKTFKGRDILKRYLDGTSLSYSDFRNLIISRMADAQFRPAGMRVVIDGILAS